MAFGCVFRHNEVATAKQYLINNKLKLIWYSVLSEGVFTFVVDRQNKYYYVMEGSELRRRSIETGTLQKNNFESAGLNTRIFGIDINENVWTWETNGNKISKWLKDLNDRVEYTLKPGNVLNDNIYFAALSLDCQYIFLSGSANYNYVCKYDINDISGNPLWARDLGTDNVHYMFVDNYGNLYVSSKRNYGDGVDGIKRTYKLANDGTDCWISGWIYGGSYGCYCKENEMIYLPVYGNKSISGYDRNTILQYRANDGQLIAKTASCVAKGYCCSINQNRLYVGSYNTGGAIYAFDISDDWQDGIELPVDSYQASSSQYHVFSFDPTGYVYEKLKENFVSEASETKGEFQAFLGKEIKIGSPVRFPHYYNERLIKQLPEFMK
jgi:hypothetical protein